MNGETDVSPETAFLRNYSIFRIALLPLNPENDSTSNGLRASSHDPSPRLYPSDVFLMPFSLSSGGLQPIVK